MIVRRPCGLRRASLADQDIATACGISSKVRRDNRRNIRRTDAGMFNPLIDALLRP
jgi:hypothetical protein